MSKTNTLKICSDQFSLTKHRLRCYMERIYNKDKHEMFKNYRYRKGILLTNMFKKRRRVLNIRERRHFIFMTKQKKDSSMFQYRFSYQYEGIFDRHLFKFLSRFKRYSTEGK